MHGGQFRQFHITDIGYSVAGPDVPMSMPVDYLNALNAPCHFGLSKVEPMSCSPQNAFKGMQGMSACTPHEDSLPSMLHMQMRHCLTQYRVMHRCIRNCINTKCLNTSSGARLSTASTANHLVSAANRFYFTRNNAEVQSSANSSTLPAQLSLPLPRPEPVSRL